MHDKTMLHAFWCSEKLVSKTLSQKDFSRWCPDVSEIMVPNLLGKHVLVVRVRVRAALCVPVAGGGGGVGMVGGGGGGGEWGN